MRDEMTHDRLAIAGTAAVLRTIFIDTALCGVLRFLDGALNGLGYLK